MKDPIPYWIGFYRFWKSRDWVLLNRMIQAIKSTPSQYFQTPLQGMQQAMKDFNQASERISQGEITPENMVATMEAKILFKANAQVVKTQDEMLGTLFNAKA